MPSQRCLRLLLIEDVDDIQAILRFSLGTLSGWQVFTAKSTQAWFALAQDKLPDVIVVDGDPNAREILIQLKADALTQEIPVICLVSRDRVSDQLQIQQDGAAAIVGKPFDPIALMQIILNIVELDSENEVCP
ncbi:MAG: response regulator [Leptolyngbya sp. SIOISBB]|nr:response regulator [Leptolyngbya sp. SIOISBB]